MKAFFIALLDKPGALVIGACLLGFGWYMSIAPGQDRNLANVALALGGVVLSWAVSESLGERAARTSYASKVATIVRGLEGANALLARTVRDLSAGNIDTEVALYVLQDSGSRYSGVAYELEELCGGNVTGFEAVVDRSARFDELFNRFSQIVEKHGQRPAEETEASEALESLLQELEALRTRMEGVRRGDGAPEERADLLVERVSCPECGASTSLRIGTRAGESAMKLCAGCGIRFHAHRRADGSIMTRPWGGGNKIVVVTVPCPEPGCGNPLEFHFGPDEQRTQTRYCLSCIRGDPPSNLTAMKVNVDPQARVVTASVRESVLSGPVVEDSGTRTQVRCPNDREVITAFYRDSSSRFYAVCPVCRRLIQAKQDVTKETAVV